MLKFRFDNQYPIVSPTVTFVVDNEFQAPLHPVRLSLFRTSIIFLKSC